MLREFHGEAMCRKIHTPLSRLLYHTIAFSSTKYTSRRVRALSSNDTTMLSFIKCLGKVITAKKPSHLLNLLSFRIVGSRFINTDIDALAIAAKPLRILWKVKPRLTRCTHANLSPRTPRKCYQLDYCKVISLQHADSWPLLYTLLISPCHYRTSVSRSAQSSYAWYCYWLLFPIYDIQAIMD